MSATTVATSALHRSNQITAEIMRAVCYNQIPRTLRDKIFMQVFTDAFGLRATLKCWKRSPNGEPLPRDYKTWETLVNDDGAVPREFLARLSVEIT